MIKKKRSFISSVLKLSLVLLLNQIGMAKKVNAKIYPFGCRFLKVNLTNQA